MLNIGVQWSVDGGIGASSCGHAGFFKGDLLDAATRPEEVLMS
jgi:hypothetical protein